MRRALALAGMILLSACASITTGTEQSIFVETPKVTGAACELTDSKLGKWTVKSTPGSVKVKKGDGPMNVVCTKAGYEAANISVEETLVGATLGNIILGGGIGILVDAASGAAQKYPDRIVVRMTAITEEVALAALAAARAAKLKKSKSAAKQTARSPDLKTQPRRPRRKGFQRLINSEITTVFQYLRADTYPDEWTIEFSADGKWEGTKPGWNPISGYGTWRVEDDMHCLTIDDHDGRGYDVVEPGRCYEVWIDETVGLIRLINPDRPSDQTIVKEDAFGDIDKLLLVQK